MSDPTPPLLRRGNHPFMPEPVRPLRRTGRTYRDPTGSDATGEVTKEDKYGATARARAARRQALEEIKQWHP